jgi:hypothetical protein
LVKGERETRSPSLFILPKLTGNLTCDVEDWAMLRKDAAIENQESEGGGDPEENAPLRLGSRAEVMQKERAAI